MIEELIERLQTNPSASRSLRQWSEADVAQRLGRFQHARIRLENRGLSLLGRHRPRVVATACWEFPIYSQTFVYQELAHLVAEGFDLRFLYSKLNPRSHLPAKFSALWRAKRKLVLHSEVCSEDYAYFAKKTPEKVAGLIAKLCDASGIGVPELKNHYHFQQAFAFARMVESCRPDYLHSYFFYEGTLFTYVASELLNIPRGVSCYADHMLDDYALKLVPLHMEQCSIVVATSARIKRELLGLAPHANPGTIIVKPNAVDAKRFPVTERPEPEPGQPYRLSCVSRIEPKKGILYLVEAIRLLRDKNVPVELHVIGGVDSNPACVAYAEEVERRIRELSLTNAVHLEGRKAEPEVKEFLRKSHLFVAPFVETESGDKDGIPTALLEAMCTGLPAVATDAGSITEVIEDGVDGLVVPQRDSAGLCGAIENLLRNPGLRRQLARAAALKIREKFEVEQCEQIFHRRLHEVIATRKGHVQ